VAVAGVDRLVAVGVHPAADGGPRKPGVAHVGVIRRRGVGEDRGQRSVRPVEHTGVDVDRDTVDRPVVPDERAVVEGVDRSVAGGAVVRLRPSVAVKHAVDDGRIAVEGIRVVAAGDLVVTVEVGHTVEDGRREASGVRSSRCRARQH
jgi:hypothetical protein